MLLSGKEEKKETREDESVLSVTVKKASMRTISHSILAVA